MWMGIVRLLLCVVLVVGVAACAADKQAEVKGLVTFNGKPLERGAITFTPADGQAPVTGGSIDQGRYATRVYLGTMKVAISGAKIVGQKKLYDDPKSPVRPVTAELLPPQYNEETELQFDVVPGSNEKNFDLRD
jgi:hypothetical protein